MGSSPSACSKTEISPGAFKPSRSRPCQSKCLLSVCFAKRCMSETENHASLLTTLGVYIYIYIIYISLYMSFIYLHCAILHICFILYIGVNTYIYICIDRIIIYILRTFSFLRSLRGQSAPQARAEASSPAEAGAPERSRALHGSQSLQYPFKGIYKGSLKGFLKGIYKGSIKGPIRVH